MKHLLDAHQSFNRPNLQVAQQAFEKKKNIENKPTDSCWHAKLWRFWRYINVIPKIHILGLSLLKKRYQTKKNILKEHCLGTEKNMLVTFGTKATFYAEWLQSFILRIDKKKNKFGFQINDIELLKKNNLMCFLFSVKHQCQIFSVKYAISTYSEDSNIQM